jgi:hypothetical protein
MLKQEGELAAAQHAGLIDHQHGPGVQLLPPSVQLAEEAVAGGHVLEPSPCRLMVAMPVGADARSR